MRQLDVRSLGCLLEERMLPIQRSAISAARSLPAARAPRRETWREALNGLSWFVLILTLVWALATVFFLVLR